MALVLTSIASFFKKMFLHFEGELINFNYLLSIICFSRSPSRWLSFDIFSTANDVNCRSVLPLCDEVGPQVHETSGTFQAHDIDNRFQRTSSCCKLCQRHDCKFLSFFLWNCWTFRSVGHQWALQTGSGLEVRSNSMEWSIRTRKNCHEMLLCFLSFENLRFDGHSKFEI